MTLPGLAGGTAISMTFVAKVFGSAAAPAATTWSMFLALADANTSAGAPEVIWVARAELAAKLKVTFDPRVGRLELLAERGERLVQRRGGEAR